MSGATQFTMAVKVVKVDRTAGKDSYGHPLDVVHLISNYSSEDSRSNPAIPFELVMTNTSLTNVIAAGQTYLGTFVRQS